MFPSSVAHAPSNSPPLSPSPSTSTTSPNPKADQIVHRFFNKFVLVVVDARTTTVSTPPDASEEGKKKPKVDKWFNLETPDCSEPYKSTLAPFKSVSLTTSPNQPPPTLNISIFLSIPSSTPNPNHNTSKVLVHHFPSSDPSSEPLLTQVKPQPRFILLESHTLTLLPSQTQIELPQVYKQSIALFRSLYSLLRILPAWKVHRKLRRRVGGVGVLGIEVRVRYGSGAELEPGVAAFDGPRSQPPDSLVTETVAFPAIPSPLGSLSLQTTYRKDSTYTLEPLEALLSKNFLFPSQPQDSIQFTPTLTSALQRQRLQSFNSSSSPKSGPSANSFPIRPGVTNPPSLHSGTSPLGSIPARNRTQTSLNQNVTSNVTPGSSSSPPRTSHVRTVSLPGASRWKDVESDLPFAVGPSGGAGIGIRKRKESLRSSNSGGSGDRPGVTPIQPQPSSYAQPSPIPSASASSTSSNAFPIRRPSLNAAHPFKPPASPSSLRQHSPLSAVGPVAGGSSSSAGDPIPEETTWARRDPSTSSLDTPVTAQTQPAPSAGRPVPGVKRYPSTFAHRYNSAGSGGGGVGSAPAAGAGLGLGLGLGGVGPGPGSDASGSAGKGSGVSGLVEGGLKRISSQSFLNAGADDDELTDLIKAIDSRPPLRGGIGIEEEDEDEEGEVPEEAEESGSESGSEGEGEGEAGENDGAQRSTTSSERIRRQGGAGPRMLTSRTQVDERLKRMTESFRAGWNSIEGGMRGRRGRGGGNGGAGRGLGLGIEEDGAASGSGSSGSVGGRGGQPVYGSLPRERGRGGSTSSLGMGPGRRSYESEQVVGTLELDGSGRRRT